MTTQDHHSLVEVALGRDHRAAVREFVGGEARVGDLEVVDVGMRMLQPHELFAAQGFPETYDLLAGTLTKTQQIELAGNSVAPPVAAAVVRAQLGGAEAVAA